MNGIGLSRLRRFDNAGNIQIAFLGLSLSDAVRFVGQADRQGIAVGFRIYDDGADSPTRDML